MMMIRLLQALMVWIVCQTKNGYPGLTMRKRKLMKFVYWQGCPSSPEPSKKASNAASILPSKPEDWQVAAEILEAVLDLLHRCMCCTARAGLVLAEAAAAWGSGVGPSGGWVHKEAAPPALGKHITKCSVYS